MQSVDVDVATGVRLRVRTWPGAGRPYLLVHGLSSNARLWDGVAARISGAGHPVYAVDLRSHGESSAGIGSRSRRPGGTPSRLLTKVISSASGRPSMPRPT